MDKHKVIQTQSYMGVEGTFEYSEEDGVFCGKLLVDRGLYSYEAKEFDGIHAAFCETVREYLRDQSETR
jgi:predicted HicB family RNase H-like nuclease